MRVDPKHLPGRGWSTIAILVWRRRTELTGCDEIVGFSSRFLRMTRSTFSSPMTSSSPAGLRYWARVDTINHEHGDTPSPPWPAAIPSQVAIAGSTGISGTSTVRQRRAKA